MYLGIWVYFVYKICVGLYVGFVFVFIGINVYLCFCFWFSGYGFVWLGGLLVLVWGFRGIYVFV